MKGIIPVGGKGTRMRPLTFSSNKHFIPVANKPLIYYPIEALVNIGVREIGITYNPGALEEAKMMLGDGSRWGVKFEFILQEKPAGLANIIQVAEEFINGDSFVLHLGDNIFVDGLKELAEYFEKNKPSGLLAMLEHPHNERMGVPYFDKKGRVNKLVEKPEKPPHKFAIPGVYFADNNYFKAFKKDPIKPSARGELEVLDGFQWMIDHDYIVEVKEYTGKWLDPGKFDDWIESNQYLLDRNLEENIESEVDVDSTIENRVAIGKNCHIVNSIIRGPVSIADNVEIVNSYIGPFTSIGEGCELESSSIENSVLVKGVKIRNVEKVIDASLIGNDSEIIGNDSPRSRTKLFIGEKCVIEL
jgi:glucose-1-phosphate thymidylyltransferase